MKINRKYKWITFFSFFLIGFFMNVMLFCVRAEAAVHVVLDAGHDEKHIGAHANGLKEEEINLKIAAYCYEELKTYTDVNVHLIRTSNACPYDASSSVVCNKKRVEYAKQAGANVYVSLHNNAAPSTSARGATVYYPNMNYRSDIGIAGMRLAQVIQDKLVGLGLENRGIAIRNSEDNTRYPDRSLADYYAVIKHSKYAGFPGIIIEHAFMTNESDVEGYLNTDQKLKLLGIADAKAIAEYFGLVKHWSNFTNDAQMNREILDDQKTISISLSGILNAPEVQFAVWTEENGQDDLVWYKASEISADNWNVKISAANHRYDENYIVHAYIIENGKAHLVKDSSFTVKRPQAALTVMQDDVHHTGITVVAESVPYEADVETVKIKFWRKENGANDAVWYTMKTQKGSYKASIYYSNHPESGTYVGQIVANMKSGVELTLGTIEVISNGEDIVVSHSAETKEILYAPQKHTELYKSTKEQLPQEDGVLLQGFSIYENQLLMDQTAVNPEGDYIVNLTLPESVTVDQITVYGLEISGSVVQIKEKYPVEKTEEGLLKVRAKIPGFYVICVNQNIQNNGDVNFDGQVTLVDARITLQFALGIKDYTQEEQYTCDTDSNGEVELSDAKIVLQNALGIL